LRKAIIQSLHAEEHGIHQGVLRTYSKVYSYCWWPNQHADVEKHIYNCDVCIATSVRRNPVVESRTISYSLQPTAVWHLDFIGPLPSSIRGGNKYALTCIDEASGYLEVIAMPQQNAVGLKLAIEKLITRHGIPYKLRSDNGSAFIDSKWRKYANKLGIKLDYSPAYHPQSNGRIERANRSIKEAIQRKLASNNSNDKRDWFDVLDIVIHGLNTSVSAALGGTLTPFEFIYGRKPRSILDNKFELSTEELALDQWLDRTKSNIKFAVKALLKERKRAEEKRDLVNSEQKSMHAYNINDRVLVFDKTEKVLANLMVSNGDDSPFQSNQAKWKPGVIMEIKGESGKSLVYTIQLDNYINSVSNRGKNKLILDVHADHLKPFPSK